MTFFLLPCGEEKLKSRRGRGSMQRGNEKEEVRRRSGSFSKLEKKKERYLLKKGKKWCSKESIGTRTTPLHSIYRTSSSSPAIP